MCVIQGVHIVGLGTFTFSQQKLDMGNKLILLQRPIFLLSEKLLLSHGLKQTRPLAPGREEGRGGGDRGGEKGMRKHRKGGGESLVLKHGLKQTRPLAVVRGGEGVGWGGEGGQEEEGRGKQVDVEGGGQLHRLCHQKTTIHTFHLLNQMK